MELLIIIFIFLVAIRLISTVKRQKKRKMIKFKNSLLQTDCTGKKVLITGGNRGIGLHTALGFCKMGAKVIIACRNESKANMAIDFIKKNCKEPNIKFENLDLSSLESVQNLINKFILKNEKIDFLINNAGVFSNKQTKNKMHECFLVNYLSHYYLTRSFIKNEILTNNARIVNVSSSFHKYGRIKLEDIPTLKKRYNMMAYSDTKLMNILFSHKLSNVFKLKSSKMTSVSVHPGYIDTGIQENLVTKWLLPLSKLFTKLFISEPWEGSLPILNAALCDIKDKENVYFDCINYVKNSKNSNPNNPQVRSNMNGLWDISAEILGIDK